MTRHCGFKLSYILLVATLLLVGCNQEYSPKPKAYPRVAYPERKYEMYSAADCPFKFEKPVYATVSHDTTYFGQKIKNDQCWLNVSFPSLNGVLNLTYKEINDSMSLAQLIEDAHTMAYKHTKKANYIEELPIKNAHGAGGIIYDLGGDAASNVQFFLTDTNHHFVRGALYFYSQPNSDSMAPILSFVKADMEHLLKTFEWK